MRPEITKLLPRKSKKDRNVRVEFICPTCHKAHVIRLTDFDRITNGKYPSPNNKKASFKTWVDKQISCLTDDQKSVINQMLSEGKSQKTIIKKFHLAHPAVLHAIIHPMRQTVTAPKQVAQEAPRAMGPAVQAKIVTHHNHAPVTEFIERPKVMVPRPDWPRLGSSEYDKLSKRDQLAANLAWHQYYKVTDDLGYAKATN